MKLLRMSTFGPERLFAQAPSPQPSPPAVERELLPLPLAGEGWGEGLRTPATRWSH